MSEVGTVKKNRKIAGAVRASLVLGISLSLVPPPFVAVERAQAASNEAPSILRITNSGAGARKRVKLGLNKALVVDLPADAHDILVADPSMADAVTRTSRRIYLFGKTVGQTNIFIFGANGDEIVSLDVEIERDIGGLEANIRRFVPDSDVKVEIVSDNIVLTGSVRTPQDSDQVVKLAKVFLKGGEATTRNMTASGGNNGGDVAIYAEGRQTSQVVNLLTVDGEDQVTLKVTVAEVRREVLKQLGFTNSVQQGSGSGFDLLTLGTSSTGLSGTVTGQIGKYALQSTIDALEQAKVLKTLAEPTLTAISGQSATFNSGGDRLYYVPDGNGSYTLTSYNYGISLGFTPTVLSSGRISLRIQTKVSEPITSTSGVEYRKRDMETSVELPSGGSLALAGLIQDDQKHTTNGTPVANKIPVLGALFRDKTVERTETELVIIATPYLVRPVARNQLARPDDNLSPSNDAGTFLLDRVNKIYGRKEQVQPGQYHGNVGFIYK
ncbi:type II and III secretion system protein family protein [Allorhizobium borbori]|uniref:Pilus assembly protein CpaC n=1 Tax=Allorhizobium borbori TaxID=485907 RepID=A0A7W6K071_9HYPH|nr:type II and III secretion system protein family protein [Allorhizobium borbori]MBB4101705.1 pilus assembly protein CpaC [Allorhizobium borbori]